MPRQFYIPDEQRLAAILKQQARSISDVQRPTGTERERTLLRLQQAVDELQARMSVSITPADLNVTGNATVNPFPAGTRNLVFPAPVGTRRSAVLTLSGLLENDGGPSNSVTAFVELLLSGARIWAGEAVVPRLTSAPAGWSEQVSATVNIRVPSGAAPALAVRMYRVGYNSTSTTLSLTGMTATLAYGGSY